VLYDGLALVVTGSFSHVIRAGCTDALAGEESMKTKGKQLGKQLRKGIHGKRVDYVEHHFEDGLHVGIRFTDKTYLSMRFSTQIVRESAELLDVRTGNIHKVFFRR